jgi:hypothetical protein
MTAIYVKAFAGERPKVDPRHLPNEYAQIAQGCHFYHGNLSALKKPLVTGETVQANAKTIFKYLNQHWFSWNADVSIVNSPIANDPWQRVYFTGDGYPKVTNNTVFSGSNMPAAAYKLGIQAPETLITAVVTEGEIEEGEVVDSNDDEDRYYTHTFVNEQGEEGPPGEASLKVSILTPDKLDTFVTLTLQPPNVNLSNITHRRIYRTSTGGGIADYLFVAEVPIAQGSFVDNVQGDELGASLETYDYVMPPSDMQGIVSMANGILAGFTGNTQCFSEAFLSYAWPTDYQMTTEHNIVANIAIGNSVVALTEGFPYIFSGNTPDSMAANKVESSQSCVSANSAILVNGAIVYASPDGLVQLTGNSTTTLTEAIMTKEQWQSLKPSTIKAYAQEGRYLGFYGDLLNNAFIFDLSTGDFRYISTTAACGYNDLLDDALYLCNSGVITKWEASDELFSYVWRSKEYQLSDKSLSCALIKGDNLSLTGVRFFVNNNEILHIAPGNLSENAFRLPNDRGNQWEFEIYGKGEIKTMIVSDSMNTIKGLLNEA